MRRFERVIRNRSPGRPIAPITSSGSRMPILRHIAKMLRHRRPADSSARATEPPASAAASPAAVQPESARMDVEMTIPRSRLEGFAALLVGEHLAGDAPLSPSGLTIAFAGAIRRAGGSGAASVSRSPAALYTPEYWCFRIEAADERAHAVLAEAARRERLA